MAERPEIGGQHSETPFRVDPVAANTRLTFSVNPPAGYEAILLHSITFGGTEPETFQVWVSQRMASTHSVILSPWEIGQGVTVMQGITSRALGYFSLMNLDLINPHPFRAALWHINIPLEEGLRLLLAAIQRRFGTAEIVQPGVTPTPQVRPGG